MQRRFRLRGSTDIERVRRSGKSYAHPLLVLVALPNALERTRVAVSAGRRIGNAVERNRAKRLLREAIRPHLPNISSGWDILLLARRPLPTATLQKTQEAIILLVERARLWKINDGDRS